MAMIPIPIGFDPRGMVGVSSRELHHNLGRGQTANIGAFDDVRDMTDKFSLSMSRRQKMTFRAARFSAAALIASLLVQMQIAERRIRRFSGPKIAFTCKRDGNFDICVMDGDGGNEVRLTDDPAKDHEPSWSPGRQQGLRFNRDHHIYVMDSDGRKFDRINTWFGTGLVS